MRRIYPVSLIVNHRFITHVVIDPHYEKHHKESINDIIILSLVSLLHGRRYRPHKTTVDGIQYFADDNLILKDKRYRLVWLLPPFDSYIGVINAFRRPV